MVKIKQRYDKDILMFSEERGYFGLDIFVENKDKDFELEVVLHYKNSDGSTGSIIKVKSKKK